MDSYVSFKPATASPFAIFLQRQSQGWLAAQQRADLFKGQVPRFSQAKRGSLRNHLLPYFCVYILYVYNIYNYIYTLCISIHQRLRCHRKLLIKYFINYGDLLGIRFSVITKQLGEGKQRMKSHLESDSVINNDCFGVPHVWIDPSNSG